MWENISLVADFILLDIYRNLKVLFDLLDIYNMNHIISFKNRFGLRQLDLMTRINVVNLESVPYVLIMNYPILNYLHEHYGNHPHLQSFIDKISCNATKLTLSNTDNIFQMYLMTCTKKFKGFERWGPGNHLTHELNIRAHYLKHIKNSNENWSEYLQAPRSQITQEMYRDFALKVSSKMKNKMIHTNGIKVYLSGIYNRVLVIGRLDNTVTPPLLGISS